MRTSIDIDDALMRRAMEAGPYRTKKAAVEAGLKLLARRVAYRDILKWEGKLKWEGDESIDWTKSPASDAPRRAQVPRVVATEAKVVARNPNDVGRVSSKDPINSKRGAKS